MRETAPDITPRTNRYEDCDITNVQFTKLPFDLMKSF